MEQKNNGMVLRIIGAVFVFLMMQFVVGGLMAVANILLGKGVVARPTTEYLAWVTILNGMLSVLVIWKGLKMLSLKSVFALQGMRSSRNWWIGLIAIIGTLVGIVAANLLNEAIALPNLLEQQFMDMSKSTVGVLSIAVVAPLVEELIFRGAIEGYMLQKDVKPWLAIFISALIFGVMHMNPAQISYAFLIGVLFGILFWKTGNIWLCGIVHLINNSIAMVEMNILGEKAKETNYTNLMGGQANAYIAMLVLTAVCILCLTYFCKKKTEQE